MAASSLPTLPSPQELDIANYKVGSYISDLDDFASRLKSVRCSGDPKTYLEYKQQEAAGTLPGAGDRRPGQARAHRRVRRHCDR